MLGNLVIPLKVELPPKLFLDFFIRFVLVTMCVIKPLLTYQSDVYF
uniref:Uncharacterized protein n=1 Tax=Rhizophora mucronata TaxID=61149 RepID=A0A2P2QCS3_RHIMU